jgi:hypothetical protein
LIQEVVAIIATDIWRDSRSNVSNETTETIWVAAAAAAAAAAGDRQTDIVQELVERHQSDTYRHTHTYTHRQQNLTGCDDTMSRSHSH